MLKPKTTTGDFLENIRNLPESEPMIKGLGPFKPGRDYNERIRDRQSKNRISAKVFRNENEMLNPSSAQWHILKKLEEARNENRLNTKARRKTIRNGIK
jgi:hypothetical protein